MVIGTIDINPDGWDRWTYAEFLKFYETNLKDYVKESPEEVANILGVKQITIKVKE